MIITNDWAVATNFSFLCNHPAVGFAVSESKFEMWSEQRYLHCLTACLAWLWLILSANNMTLGQRRRTWN